MIYRLKKAKLSSNIIFSTTPSKKSVQKLKPYISNMITVTSGIKVTNNAVADPDLELRGPQFFVACPAGFSSFCDSFCFFTQNREGGGGVGGPLGPSPRSATAMYAEKA